MPDTEDRQADFGYRRVPIDEKQELVSGVFRSVASRYDLMNDLMSFGLHRAWKDALVTGDQSAEKSSVRAARCRRGHRRRRLAGDCGGRRTDPRHCMRHQRRHARGRTRARQPSRAGVFRSRGEEAPREIDDRITFTEADAEALPFADRTFDAVTIAFGIRNVTRIEAALGEAFRVLKIGGRFLCLEFSAVDVPGLQSLYDFYSFRVIPALGGIVAGDAESYRYLVELIRRFPKPQDFAAMMRTAGFARVSYQRLTGGIVALHSGWRL